MSLFGIPKWLRNIIRRNTNPMAEPTAQSYKQKLSILYAVLAWNAFGFMMYNVFKGKGDWALYHGLKSEEEATMPPGKAWAKTLGIRKATVYRIDGTNMTTYEIDEELEKAKQGEEPIAS